MAIISWLGVKVALCLLHFMGIFRFGKIELIAQFVPFFISKEQNTQVEIFFVYV